MATKETLKTRVARAREELHTSGHLVLKAPVLVRSAECAIRFLLGAILSGAEIFGSYAPFGLAMVGASGSGLDGFSALLGACLGYLTFHGFTVGLRYAAAAILTFSVAFAFYDVRLCRRAWFMPLVAALLDLATGFIYLSGRGWLTVDVIFFSTEVLLTGAFARFYRIALSPWRQAESAGPLTMKQTVCLLLLAGSLLITLTKLTLFHGVVSLGRYLGALCVLASGYQCGMGTGAAVGVAAGLAIDLAGGAPFYSMAYGFMGLMAGIFRSQGRCFTSVACALSNAVCVLWTWDTGLQLSILYEVFLSSVTFLLLPERFLRALGALALPEAVGQASAPVSPRIKRRLEESAEAFRALAQSLADAFPSSRTNDENAAAVFDRTADKVCRKCALRGTCWQREYVSTFNALNDALPAMLDRGRGEWGDFPSHFSSRCIHFSEFLAAANGELTALLSRRQYAARLSENRRAVCREYGTLAQVLSGAAAEYAAPLTPDLPRSRTLRQHLTALGIEGESEACLDVHGRLRLELPQTEALSAPEELQKLSKLMGVPLSPPAQEGERLVLTQAEPLMAVAGAAALQKNGQTVSGDTCLCFKSPGASLYAILCDGMGSGPKALADSSLAQRLLEQFLRAGVEAEAALRTVGSALALRGEETCGFTTIDLLEVDLFTGQATVYKYGAAPTYIRRGEQVRTLSAASLPAGLAGESGPDRIRFRLEAGDWVVMVSDGLLGSEGDGWLTQQLSAFSGESPKELSCALLAGQESGSDDRTVLSLQILPRQ